MRAKFVFGRDVVREVERRILNDFMDLLILSMLRCHGEVSGYDVVKYLQVRYRFLPSSGTVYSRLYEMERKGLLKGEQNGRKRVFTLTQYGAETAEAILNGKDRIVKFMAMIIQENCSKTPL